MNKTIHYDNLTIEVTRRCNMCCAHCMRGEAQDKDISSDIISKALTNVKRIREIVFTGGEVTLNTNAISETLRICKDRHIYVESFYITTNGLNIPDEFLDICVDWYNYIIECRGKTNKCGLALSSDKYHTKIPELNLWKLRNLSFFREEDKKADWNFTRLLNLGRAKKLVNAYKRDANRNYPPDIIGLISENDNGFVFGDSFITVTADGNFLSDCDYEYAETESLKIGSVYDKNWIQTLLTNQKNKDNISRTKKGNSL